MADPPNPPLASQTVIGDGNIQIAGSGNAIARVINYFQGSPGGQIELRNRQNMLKNVRNTWIEGVLEKSLYNEIFLELGLETKPDAVDHPWDMQVQMPKEEPRALPGNTQISEVFDQANGALLILGEPGAGKTTMLLELARQLIDRAEQDISCPIPVILNLSSWDPKIPFGAWIVNELKSKYYVPKKLGEPWVQDDRLLLLLDGLDEVKDDEREACVKSINTYRIEHQVELAVCCRRIEYEAISIPLKLGGAIFIQPLNDAQVDQYLQNAGPQLSAVRDLLLQDQDLHEFASTPLILSILVLTYKGTPEAQLRTLTQAGDCRQRLFDAYVEQMFKRRSSGQPFSLAKTKEYLGWLANHMLRSQKSIFLIEDIRLNSLMDSAIKSRLILGLCVGLGTWLFSFLVLLILAQLNTQNIFLFGAVGLSFGVVFGGLSVFDVFFNQTAVDKIYWSWREFRQKIARNKRERWIGGLALGLIGGLIGGVNGLLAIGSLLGLFGGLIIGALGGLIVGLVIGSLGGLTLGQIAGMVLALFFWVTIIISGQNPGLLSFLTLWLLFGIIFGLVGGLIQGVSGSTIESRNLPTEGIINSVKFALIIGVISSLMGGLISRSASWIIFNEFWGMRLNQGALLTFAKLIGLFTGLYGLLVGGGSFLINHYVSRWMLYRSSRLPWRVPNFLDYCTERIFLRQVGGGYIFIHRMILEYFAASAPPEKPGRQTDRKGQPAPIHGNIATWNVSKWLRGAFFLGILCVAALIFNFYTALKPYYSNLLSLNGMISFIYSGQAYSAGQSHDAETAYKMALASVKWDPEMKEPSTLNTLCWFGSLTGRAQSVTQACERAVQLQPENGALKDSRGLNRALNGDYQGAVQDFKAYSEWLKPYEVQNKQAHTYRLERQAWIEKLEAGSSPFDAETLKELEKE